MLLQEIHTKLQNLTNAKISQSELGKAMGVTRANISLRFKNKSKVSHNELKKIEKYFNVSLSDIKHIDNDLTNIQEKVSMKYFTDVIGSCGSGCFEQSQKYEMVDLPVKLIENYSAYKEYSIINAYGDSMSPTIENADKLIIAHSDFKQIVDNKIYVFSYNDKIYIKRLVQNIDEVVVISDNENKEIYKTKVINQDNIDKIYIIGQVIGIFRDLRG